VPDKVILTIMAQVKWDTNAAVETFFEKGYAEKYVASSSSTSAVSESGIKTLFKSYAGKGENIENEGIMKFFEDLNVDVEDPLTLLISMRMEATIQGQYSFDQFKKGCMSCGADSIKSWQRVIPELR
jgi:DCN1-like protein 1/2